MQELNEHRLRKPLIQDHVRLLGAAAIWGASFILNEVALVDFAPMAIATYRIVVAAVLICLICRWLGLGVRHDRRSLVLLSTIGLLNSAVPFTLIGWGQLRIDSATTAILLASSPFATLLFSHFMTRDDRFTWPKFMGLMLGFAGVTVLLGQGLLQGGGSVLGMLAVVLALGPTAIAYVLRAQIVQINGAVYMSNVGYLIPLFAMLWGWLFLSQQPTAAMWVALLLILAGIAVGQRSKVQSQPA